MALSPTSSRGGAAGFAPVGCVFGSTTDVDIHAVGTVTVTTLDTILNNVSDQTVIPLPATIGVSLAAGVVTTTVAGFWAYEVLLLSTTGNDATLQGILVAGTKDFASRHFGPPGTGEYLDAAGTSVTGVVGLPSGVALTPRVVTRVAALSNPYLVNIGMTLTRLA